MKIILSRKGFDSSPSNGGCASPILPDGTLLSMPIPNLNRSSGLKYSELSIQNYSYDDIWKQLGPSHYVPDCCCHLDPDIRCVDRAVPIHDWKPAFGQVDRAQTHLQNQKVRIGDIFLFFGWFKRTEYSHKSSIQYLQGAPNQHIIYGYLQIGKILIGDMLRDYYWHPHAKFDENEKGNTLYLPTEHLTLAGQATNMPGYGCFQYSEKLVLTAPGSDLRSIWQVPEWFKNVNISYHSKNSFINGYFQSVHKGQEFVIEDSPNNESWLKSLISD